MLGITILMIISSVNVQKNLITIGDFVIINTYLLQLYQPLNFLGSVYREIRQSIVDMENMFSLLKIKNKNKEFFKRKKSIKDHFVEFQNVSFSYENKRNILKNLNFVLNKKNQKIAIVGPTGSGKTTIFRLFI